MLWFLWRHAHALEGADDLARPLSQRGLAEAEHAAAWLEKRFPYNGRILVSPAIRAQQTASAFDRPFITAEELAPDATVQTVLNFVPIDDMPSLIVGHQPTLGELALELTGDDFDALEWNPKPSSICEIEFDEVGKGKVVEIYEPR